VGAVFALFCGWYIIKQWYYDFIRKLIFNQNIPKPHANVETSLVSTCSHGIQAGLFCALCYLRPYFLLNTVSSCSHNFTHFPIKPHNLGMVCDFDGGDHVAATGVHSMVHVCHLCNAVICSGCHVG